MKKRNFIKAISFILLFNILTSCNNINKDFKINNLEKEAGHFRFFAIPGKTNENEFTLSDIINEYLENDSLKYKKLGYEEYYKRISTFYEIIQENKGSLGLLTKNELVNKMIIETLIITHSSSYPTYYVSIKNNLFNNKISNDFIIDDKLEEGIKVYQDSSYNLYYLYLDTSIFNETSLIDINIKYSSNI